MFLVNVMGVLVSILLVIQIMWWLGLISIRFDPIEDGREPSQQPSKPTTIVEPPPAPKDPPAVPPFVWDGSRTYCTQCRVDADVQMEFGQQMAVCPTCGRSEPVAAILR